MPIDTRDAQSSTPFLDAVAAGQTKCARLLLQRGADIKASDIFMKNCIHIAVENENLETLQMLLEERSVLWNLYRPDVNERVPLHYAAMVKDIRVGKRKYGFVFCICLSIPHFPSLQTLLNKIGVQCLLFTTHRYFTKSRENDCKANSNDFFFSSSIPI